MAFCGKCGTQLPEGAAFCVGCGAPQGAASQQTVAQEMPQANPQPTVSAAEPAKAVAKSAAGIGKWIALAAVALVVIAAVVLVAMNWDKIFKSDETLIRERIQAYEEAVEAGDYEGMLDCMDAATRAITESSMGLMDGLLSDASGLGIGMTDMFGFASMLGDFLTIDIKDIRIDGDTATVRVEMKISIFGMTQSSEEADLPMVKEDGDWYIGGVDNMISDQLTGIYT